MVLLILGNHLLLLPLPARIRSQEMVQTLPTIRTIEGMFFVVNPLIHACLASFLEGPPWEVKGWGLECWDGGDGGRRSFPHFMTQMSGPITIWQAARV